MTLKDSSSALVRASEALQETRQIRELLKKLENYQLTLLKQVEELEAENQALKAVLEQFKQLEALGLSLIQEELKGEK